MSESDDAEPAAPLISLKAGQKVGGGNFTLVRMLGRGGMGVVWLARDESLNEDVALKFLPPEVASDAIALDDLRRETRKSRRLTHPHIIRIHAFHGSPGEPAFISMEFVDGPNLTSLRLQQLQRCFAWKFIEPLMRQLCVALEYAHGEKVIHRDLKPSNLMLDAKGRLKLADFGIAATMSDSMSRVSLQNATSGTLVYMSPQQLRGETPRATDDIYALGATMYELLTSKPPFFRGDIADQVKHEKPMPLNERLADFELTNEIPAGVNELIMTCLAKEAEQRPQTAQEILKWLETPATARTSTQYLAPPTHTSLEVGRTIAAPPSIRSTPRPSPPPDPPPPSSVPEPVDSPDPERLSEKFPALRKARERLESQSPPAAKGGLKLAKMLAGFGLFIAIIISLFVLHERKAQKPANDLTSVGQTSAPIPPPAPESAVFADLSVTVVPANAELLTNGVSTGHQNYPLQLRGAPGGSMSLEGRLEGYSNYIQSVPFPAAGTSTNFSIVLQPELSSIIVNITPPEAELSTNGVPMARQTLPVQFNGHLGDNLSLEAHLDGYSNLTTSVLFPGPGASTNENIVLQPKLAFVNLNVLPSQAILFTNGVSMGPQSYPVQFQGRPGQRLSCEARLDGYTNSVKSVFFPEAGLSINEEITLQPQPAFLIVKSDPAVPSVYIDDGQATGPRATVNLPDGIEVNVGKTVLLTLTNEGWQPLSTNIPALKPGERREIDFGRLTPPAGWQYRASPGDLVKAADGGNPDAIIQLGDRARLGLDGQVDYSQALKWYRQAADKKLPAAYGRMGLLCEHVPNLAGGKEEWLRWYREGTDLGDAVSMIRWAAALQSGEAVEKSPEKADLLFSNAVPQIRLAAESGDSLSINLLGVIYANGWGVPKDNLEAVKWIRSATEAGNSQAAAQLGMFYANGRGVTQDYDEAVRWYRKSADAGNEQGEAALGTAYLNGKGVSQDADEALRWLRKAAEMGYEPAEAELGYLYSSGKGVAQDYDEAVKWYRKAADGGSNQGANGLGTMYQNGYGVDKDNSEAVKWYRKAAESGYALAENNLGYMYANGYGVDKDDSEAAKWYRKAAEAGNALGENNLGLMYQNGRGVSQDMGEALKWYRKAAEAKDIQGEYDLGNMYLNGWGTEKDYNGALKWFRESAAAGNSFSEVNLGYMYASGYGVDKDYYEAVKLYRKAAEAGNAQGECNLGVMYENGWGVQKDREQAIQWYRKAAIQGLATAQAAVKRLEQVRRLF